MTIDVERLRELVDRAKAVWPGVLYLKQPAHLADSRCVTVDLEKLLNVLNASGEWRDAKCSRRAGCSSYTEEHDEGCPVEATARALVAAIDAARGVQS